MPHNSICSGIILTKLTLLVSLIGCSGSAQPVGTLKGSVTFDGKPVTKVRVLVQSSSNGKAASAAVDSDGNYEFKQPLEVGKYVVHIDPIDETPVAGEGDPNAPPAKRTDVPEKYQTGGDAGLTVEVKEEPATFDIKMIK